jgi:hypothetical protein
MDCTEVADVLVGSGALADDLKMRQQCRVHSNGRESIDDSGAASANDDLSNSCAGAMMLASVAPKKMTSTGLVKAAGYDSSAGSIHTGLLTRATTVPLIFGVLFLRLYRFVTARSSELPLGNTKNTFISFVGDFQKKIRLLFVFFGKGQSSISHGANICHGASLSVSCLARPT